MAGTLLVSSHYGVRNRWWLAALLVAVVAPVRAEEKGAAGSAVARPITFTGRVFNCNGEPIEGAKVAAYQFKMMVTKYYEPAKITNAFEQRPITNQKGEFKIQASLPNEFWMGVLVEKEGFAPYWSSGSRFEKKTEKVFEVRLQSLKHAKGRVTDLRGNPIAKAEVFQSGNTSTRTSTLTNLKGEFDLPGVPEFHAFLFVRKEGYRFGGRVFESKLERNDIAVRKSNETPPAMHTLSPLLSPQQEREWMKRLAEPVWLHVMRKGDLRSQNYNAQWFAKVDPWRVLEECRPSDPAIVAEILAATNLPEALTLVDAAQMPKTRCQAYFRVLAQIPRTDQKTREQILKLVIDNARMINIPEQQIEYLSNVAIHLYAKGDRDRAKQLMDEITPLAEKLGSERVRMEFAEALALFDFKKAMSWVREFKDFENYELIHFRIARRLADISPADSEAILRDLYIRHDAELDAQRPILTDPIGRDSFFEIKIAAVCYKMALVDTSRATAIAERMRDPQQRAYTRGLIADRLASTNKAQALTLIQLAMNDLQTAMDTPEIWHSLDLFDLSGLPGMIGATLLEVIEKIDPSLVEEHLWRCLALRSPHSSSRGIFIKELRTDLGMVSLISHYDRRIAKALFESRWINFQMHDPEENWYLAAQAISNLEPAFAEQVLGSAPLSEDPFQGRCVALRQFVSSLSLAPNLRRGAAVMQSHLWRPEPELQHAFMLSW